MSFNFVVYLNINWILAFTKELMLNLLKVIKLRKYPKFSDIHGFMGEMIGPRVFAL